MTPDGKNFSPNTLHLTTGAGAFGPEYPNNQLSAGPQDAVRIMSASDGTTSVVQIMLYNEVIGTGKSRRRPGDARNDDLGQALALTRAFADASFRYARTVDGILNPAPDPSAAAVKSLVRKIKQDHRRRKDIKRKAARESFREVMGWDHTEVPTDALYDGRGER